MDMEMRRDGHGESHEMVILVKKFYIFNIIQTLKVSIYS